MRTLPLVIFMVAVVFGMVVFIGTAGAQEVSVTATQVGERVIVSWQADIEVDVTITDADSTDVARNIYDTHVVTRGITGTQVDVTIVHDGQVIFSGSVPVTQGQRLHLPIVS
jgi:hypothetical protein